MRVIIAGSRTIKDYDTVEKAIEESDFDITTVVSGGASGVDMLGEEWAEKHDIPVDIFDPDEYTGEDKPKYLVRNDEMAYNADALVAVWNGTSNGTEYMIEKAAEEGLDIFVYRTDSTQLDEF